MKDKYVDNHSPFSFVHVATFKKVWFAFTQLQSFGDHFYCPFCESSTPDVVIVDGVTISLPHHLLHPRVSPPTKTTDTSPVRIGACYIPLTLLRPQTRTLLQRWAGPIHKRDKIEKFKPLETHEKETLKRKLIDKRGDDLPQLVPLMQLCCSMEKKGGEKHRSIANDIRAFIRVLSAGDPVMQIFPLR